jgi:hypothetical protein
MTLNSSENVQVDGHLGFFIPDGNARTNWQIELKFFVGWASLGEGSF